MTPAINLISGPRNISTALMYSFAQRVDLEVVDEPFYALYLLKSGKKHPGQEEILTSQPHTYEKVDQQLKAKRGKGIFIKNMAHHMEYLPIAWSRAFQHIFLIRDPAALIASFAQVIKQPDMQDIGIAAEWKLFKSLEEVLGKKPVVLDSGELLKNPPKVLKELCKRLALPWDDNMLTWKPGPRKEDGSWAKYWYQNVHRSSGFEQQQKKPRVLPENCRDLYEVARPIYETLFQHAIKA